MKLNLTGIWHGALDASSFGVPVGFNINNKGTTPVLNLRVNGSYYDSIKCYDITAGKCGYLWAEPLQSSKGKWLDIYLLVKWSTKKDGFVLGVIDGKSTEMYQGHTLNPSVPADAKVYLKQGLYHNRHISQTQIVYHDGMKVIGYHRNLP
jgi:Polysaccharide lyase